MSIIVNKNTKVIVQGITGSEGTFHSEQMIEYGTNIVAGVTPGKGGIKAINDTIDVYDKVLDAKNATNARNYTVCDSILIGENCGAHTFPYIEVKNTTAQLEHEATTSKVGEDQIFYCQQRGMSEEDALSLIVNGFCKEVFKELPFEFAVEAERLLSVSLEGSVG